MMLTTNAERNNFINNHWKYYTYLETDCLNLARFVDFREENFACSSDEIIKQLLSVCAEFDNTCKTIMSKRGQTTTITDHAKWLLDINNTDGIDIKTIRFSARNTNLIFEPFHEWNKERASKLDWWTAYTNVKHDKTKNFLDGNLKNLLNAMAALYCIEILQFKLIAKKVTAKGATGIFDVPPNISNLFYANNFSTNIEQLGDNLFAETICELQN